MSISHHSHRASHSSIHAVYRQAQQFRSKWFHNIDGPKAEALLLNHGVDGSFLARPSTSKVGDYTLSVRRDNQVTHVKIQSNGEFFDLYGGDKFATLQELVEHYMSKLGTIKETNGRVIELRHPFINEENLAAHEQSGVYTPWFHKHISGVMAEQMLREKGKQGSFLVRSSTNQPNAFVLCVLVEQQVLHIRIFYGADRGYDVGGGQTFGSLAELIDFYKRTPMVDKSGTVVHLKQPFNATRMTAAHIGARIQELELASGVSDFWVEFEELQRDTEVAPDLERIEGGRPENRLKNRFKNILPFDKTRVKLDKDLPAGAPAAAAAPSDYINANYIRPEIPFTGSREYIATQGPMGNTIADFWRMVWQENSRIIVMTTKEEERSKAKCARYWPTRHQSEEFPVHDGSIVVRNLEETELLDYKTTRLEVVRLPGGHRPRAVLHFQYLGWPDHNVPQDPSSVLSLLGHVGEKAQELEAQEDGAGPVIVHCSAGIGRTGSVIIIDMLLSYIRAHGVGCDIDIQKMTHWVRCQRSGMVQTESQYKFVYRAVRHFIASLQRHNGHDYTNLPPAAASTAAAAAAGGDESETEQRAKEKHPPQLPPRTAKSVLTANS